MTLKNTGEMISVYVKETAYAMVAAAKTAPKGTGRDTLVYAVADRDQIEKIALKMDEIGDREGVPFFKRDANNLRNCEYAVIIGTKVSPLGLKYCGNCGFVDCAEKRKYEKVPCAFNTTDLGIAVGSAVSIAMERRVDNRVMYTIGMAAKEMKILGDEAEVIFGIPLSVSSKNPFFDRG